MPGKRFEDGVRELIENIGGGGKIEAKVVVDQIYAKYQHESLDLRHPQGGKAKFLEDPNTRIAPRSLERIAATLFQDGGVRRGMIDHATDVVAGVAEEAPVELADLRASGHAIVKDGGAIVYDRPPVRARLSKSALRAKSKLRPDRWYTL